MGGFVWRRTEQEKWLQERDDFLYQDDLHTALAIVDADIFEKDKDIESDNLTCVKNLMKMKMNIVPSNPSFVQKFVYQK